MFAERYDALLFDLDGVLYLGDEPVAHAVETVASLREADARVAFLTNNSSRTPEQVVGKLGAIGIEARAAEIVTSALATADVLRERGGTAYVIGQDGIRRALAEAGIELADDGAERVDHVVVGVDVEVTYRKLARACELVERGAHLVATNPDTSFPVPDALWPGAGALLAVITATTGEEAEVIGKPHPPLFTSAARRVGASRPLVIGDRLDTDIAGAVAVGWDSLLVLTGVSTMDDVGADGIRPTFVAEDLRVLLDEAEPSRP